MSKNKSFRLGSNQFEQKENRIILNFNRKEPSLAKSDAWNSIVRSNSSHDLSNTLEDHYSVSSIKENIV